MLRLATFFIIAGIPFVIVGFFGVLRSFMVGEPATALVIGISAIGIVAWFSAICTLLVLLRRSHLECAATIKNLQGG